MNPIRTVDGETIAAVPSTYVYELQDISGPDAGRTEDTVMHKERIGQAVKIQLAWKGLDTETASAILNAFNPEYIRVRYLDLLDGTWRTSRFYVGDRSAPMYNATLDIWENISFNIIERSGERVWPVPESD